MKLHSVKISTSEIQHLDGQRYGTSGTDTLWYEIESLKQELQRSKELMMILVNKINEIQNASNYKESNTREV